MKWSRLVWWVFWRGLLCGAIQGLLFGTAVDLGFGIIFGTVIGALLGAILGLVNGVSLAAIMPPYTRSPDATADYLKNIRQAAIPLDMLVVFVCSLLFVSFLAIIPALIAAADAYYFSSGFRDYATGLTQPNNPSSLIEKRQSANYKYLIMLLVNLILVGAVAARIVGTPPEKTRIPDRYLIPTGYIGWVNVSYHFTDAPPLPLEDGYHLLVIPASGNLKTSSDVEYGVSRADEHYTYAADGTRSLLLSSPWDDNRMIWADNIGGDGSGNMYGSFFVGTEAQYNQQSEKTPTRNPPSNVLSLGSK